MLIEDAQIARFQKSVLEFYAQHARQFAWRYVDDPYKVFVSEVMLQQTQTSRVILKYEEFIATFASFGALAGSPLHAVLSVWQGLGYNRRARYLWQAAQIIDQRYGGVLPADPVLLDELPGIGISTAAAICAFAFNKPTVFIETNIRSVFIHEFFSPSVMVDDTQLIPLIQASLDRENPRRWYYALMDYGVMLKQAIGNPNRRSLNYTKQGSFVGSNRQVRGAIIRALVAYHHIALSQLAEVVGFAPERVDYALKQLEKEELVLVRNGQVTIN